MVTLNEIQKKICTTIRSSGMTQSELARKLNIKQQTIACYLSGKAMPALDTLANLCEVLDLDANDILCIHEYAENKKTVINNSFNNNSGNINFRS